MNERIRGLLEEARYKDGFPPREQVRQIKSTMSMKGNLNSGACMNEIAKAYYRSSEAVLEQFTKGLILNSNALNLNSATEIHEAVHEASTNIITEARGCLAQDTSTFGGNIKDVAAQAFEDQVPGLRDHLTRMVTLRGLQTDRPLTSVQVSGGQIGNLVVGSVNQAQLNASVQQIVTQGGPEAEAARLVHDLVEAIGRIDAAQKAEQAQLYDLVKGLLQQIRLPKEERSPSTILAISDRLIQVAKVSSEVVQLIQQHLPQILALLGIG